MGWLYLLLAVSVGIGIMGGVPLGRAWSRKDVRELLQSKIADRAKIRDLLLTFSHSHNPHWRDDPTNRAEVRLCMIADEADTFDGSGVDDDARRLNEELAIARCLQRLTAETSVLRGILNESNGIW